MRYRTKPVVIEAFQMTRERRDNHKDWPEWLVNARRTAWPKRGALSIIPTDGAFSGITIATLEGEHVVSFGDWIIRGVKGELYPCKPDIFEMTHEPAPDNA